MLRCARNRSRPKYEVDKLMELLNEYNNSQELQKVHRLIPINDMYLEQLEKNFNKYNGLEYYDSFEEYLNIIVVPYLKKQNIKIEELKKFSYDSPFYLTYEVI